MEENEARTGQEGGSTPEAMPSMEELLDQADIALELPQSGQILEGTVVGITDAEVMVSIGAKSEGVISTRELERLAPDERAKIVEGSTIPVYVVKPEDQNGNVALSYVRAREEKDWEWVEALMNEGTPFDGMIQGYNKGGLIVPIGTLRGFIPASQIGASRRVGRDTDTPEQRWSKMVNEPIRVRVIEVDRSRRRLILSERAALQETRESLKERLLDNLNEGDVREGRVTSLADFGAFVNIDGADGLVHLSEVSWEHINHPGDVLKVGQKVSVKVISVDRDRKRIGLSIRQLQEDPWVSKVKALRVGQLVEGVITHLTKFGAFAQIGGDADLEGLIHISELSEQRIGHPKEAVKEGDKLTLRIIKIDVERRRIGLSLRKVDSAAYADLDWKMALAEEIQDIDEEDIPDASPDIEDDVEVEAEAPEATEASEVAEEAEAAETQAGEEAAPGDEPEA